MLLAAVDTSTATWLADGAAEGVHEVKVPNWLEEIAVISFLVVVLVVANPRSDYTAPSPRVLLQIVSRHLANASACYGTQGNLSSAALFGLTVCCRRLRSRRRPQIEVIEALSKTAVL